MDLLPYEILFEILLDIKGVKTVINLCGTNSVINAICNDQYFWKKRLERVYPRIAFGDVDADYKEIYKWAHNTGIGNLLRYPPKNSGKVLTFIKPDPSYALNRIFRADTINIGGVEIFRILPDIVIRQNSRGKWRVDELPRNLSKEDRNLILRNNPTKILHNENELNSYISNLVTQGYFQLASQNISGKQFRSLNKKGYIGNIINTTIIPDVLS